MFWLLPGANLKPLKVHKSRLFSPQYPSPRGGRKYYYKYVQNMHSVENVHTSMFCQPAQSPLQVASPPMCLLRIITLNWNTVYLLLSNKQSELLSWFRMWAIGTLKLVPMCCPGTIILPNKIRTCIRTNFQSTISTNINVLIHTVRTNIHVRLLIETKPELTHRKCFSPRPFTGAPGQSTKIAQHFRLYGSGTGRENSWILQLLPAK